jgi:hypothetical protein
MPNAEEQRTGIADRQEDGACCGISPRRWHMWAGLPGEGIRSRAGGQQALGHGMGGCRPR